MCTRGTSPEALALEYRMKFVETWADRGSGPGRYGPCAGMLAQVIARPRNFKEHYNRNIVMVKWDYPLVLPLGHFLPTCLERHDKIFFTSSY